MISNLKEIVGYDNNGVVYDGGDFILRKVSSSYSLTTKQIIEIYKNFNLSKLGIVNTDILNSQNDFILKHEKHLISYPYEWSVNMFKDALLFHLTLFIELNKYNLTLKDAIPSNIIFDYQKPIFVDFMSLVTPKELINEKWLFKDKKIKLKDKRFIVFQEMFLPFILIPFVFMVRGNYSFARRMLCYRACNVKDCVIPSWKDLKLYNFLKYFKFFYYTRFNRKTDFIFFCKRLLNFLEKLDVTPIKSNYDSYYSNKNEDFCFSEKSSWKNKQKNVYRILDLYKPKTVLDLGANTGWFSVLAARHGAKVIATDVDESCIDLLYKYSKDTDLKILSLFLPFSDLNKSVYGINDASKALNSQKNPLFLAPIMRFKSDCVFCLALVHHLVLGLGISIKKVFKLLSLLTKKTLILEYVSLEDLMIKSEPDFFKNLNRNNLQSYNLDIFIKEGLLYFKDIEILDSHPDTRRLLIFTK
ncbi:hypothetical protein GF322_01640 [Candidatus Dependentiae bacterium]|nr:hypothetical protein [Candidatus Dependentiae bacterium]